MIFLPWRNIFSLSITLVHSWNFRLKLKLLLYYIVFFVKNVIKARDSIMKLIPNSSTIPKKLSADFKIKVFIRHCAQNCSFNISYCYGCRILFKTNYQIIISVGWTSLVLELYAFSTRFMIFTRSYQKSGNFLTLLLDNFTCSFHFYAYTSIIYLIFKK